MAARVWRFFVAVMDWRTTLRWIFRKPLIDVVFITNMRDDKDRRTFLGRWRPPGGQFNGPRYMINGVLGRTRVLDLTADDLSTEEGRSKARLIFTSAVQWAKGKGARVILLAAGTKRLFGEDGAELKTSFPDMTFTIGDNGTMLLLLQETLRALEKADVRPGPSRIGVLGPYGLLGEQVVRILIRKGYEVVGAGCNAVLEDFGKEYGIPVSHSIAGIGTVDAVVACTHSPGMRLREHHIDLLRREGKKLLVIDVAEPSNMRFKEYAKCRDRVIRQDAGNAYSPRLKYVLGWISYKMFRLSRGVTFGCFAEALSLFSALRRGENVEGIGWFSVNDDNMRIVGTMFEHERFQIPSPRCFGKGIKSFDLAIDPSCEKGIAKLEKHDSAISCPSAGIRTTDKRIEVD